MFMAIICSDMELWVSQLCQEKNPVKMENSFCFIVPFIFFVLQVQVSIVCI